MTTYTENEAEALAVLKHHIDALRGLDLDGVMEDYVDESIMVLPFGTSIGVDAIRGAMQGFLADPEGLRTIEITQKYIGKGAVLQKFRMNAGKENESRGTEVFVVRDGKIAFQAMEAYEAGPA